MRGRPRRGRRPWLLRPGSSRRSSPAHGRSGVEGERTSRCAAARRWISLDLFYWQGIRATGIDRIAVEAGVATTTLYRLFASKDGLIAAYVERAAREYREWFTATLEAAPNAPRERILAIFAALEEQVQPDRCRGCPFLMAMAELPDPELAAHQQAVATKAWVREQFGVLVRELAERHAVADPALLADQLALVMEGVYASVQALGIDGPARQAGALVEALIDAAGAPEHAG